MTSVAMEPAAAPRAAPPGPKSAPAAAPPAAPAAGRTVWQEARRRRKGASLVTERLYFSGVHGGELAEFLLEIVGSVFVPESQRVM